MAYPSSLLTGSASTIIANGAGRYLSGSVLVYPPAAQNLGLTEPDKNAQSRYFPFTDTGVHMRAVDGVQESFLTTVLATQGAAYLASPGVHLPDDMFDGTVGTEVLQSHRVTMDFKNMRFWLQ